MGGICFDQWGEALVSCPACEDDTGPDNESRDQTRQDETRRDADDLTGWTKLVRIFSRWFRQGPLVRQPMCAWVFLYWFGGGSAKKTTTSNGRCKCERKLTHAKAMLCKPNHTKSKQATPSQAKLRQARESRDKATHATSNQTKARQGNAEQSKLLSEICQQGKRQVKQESGEEFEIEKKERMTNKWQEQ